MANGLKEKDLCLTIALKLRNVLNQQYKGHTNRRDADIKVADRYGESLGCRLSCFYKHT